MKKAIFMLFVSVCLGNLFGKNFTDIKPYKKHFISILSENDAYFNEYVDEYYSAGTVLEYTSAEYDFSKEKSKLAFLKYLSILGQKSPKATRYSLALAQDVYTPYYRGYPIDPQDHPYAGYLRMNFQVSQRRENSLENLTLSLGVVGKAALAEQTQEIVHKLTDNPTFYGWNTQLKNEFILNFNYEVIKRLFIIKTSYFSIDTLPALDLALGNADTHIRVGTRLRIGYNLESDFGVDKVNTSFSGNKPYNDNFSLYIFGGIFGTYQAKNIFIQGNTFGPYTDLVMKNFFYDAEVGGAILYKGFRLSYSVTHVSQTFQSQPKPHNFGSIELNFAF